MRRGLIFVSCCLIASCKLHGSSGADAGSSGGLFSTLATLVSFEGEIEMKTKSGAGSFGVATVFKIKGSKMRTELSALGTDYVSIMDMEGKKSISLDTKGHTYTETDLSAASAAAKTKPKSTTKVVATNRKDVVAGYTCEIYEIQDLAGAGGPPVEICVASGISMVAFGLSGPFSYFSKGGNDDAWGAVMSHGFPLRITMRDPKGAPIMTLEATRVEKKTEPDALFEVPAGYTKAPAPGTTLGPAGSP